MLNNYVLVAGSFAFLHKGHKSLIKQAFLCPEKVLIGLASDNFIAHKKYDYPDFLTRQQELLIYLKRFSRKARMISFDTPYDYISTWRKIKKIIISPENETIVREINLMRQKNHLLPLEIIKLDFALAEDGQPISSSRILCGEIDREGKLYLPTDFVKEDLFISENVRLQLKKPWGDFCHLAQEKNKFLKQIIFTVGDISTKKIMEHKIKINLAVIDDMVQRVKISAQDQIKSHLFLEKYFIANPPGLISKKLIQQFGVFRHDISQRQILLKIKGEDDLSALLVILIAPLGSYLFYGQPNKGLICVHIKEKIKNRARQLIQSLL